jgi:hypothetical protein
MALSQTHHSQWLVPYETRHWLLKIRVRSVKFQIYEWQRATGSGAFNARLKHVTVSGAFHGVFPYLYETRDAFASYIYKMRSHLRGVWTKRASGAFPKNNETRHCQWRAAIRIFEILRFSLLFLIILI